MCGCWSVIAGSLSGIASCKLGVRFARAAEFSLGVVIFVGGACICLTAGGAHAQASPPLPKQRLLIKQRCLAGGRENGGWNEKRVSVNLLRERCSRCWTLKEAMLLTTLQTMTKNIPAQVWIIVRNLGTREFGVVGTMVIGACMELRMNWAYFSIMSNTFSTDGDSCFNISTVM